MAAINQRIQDFYQQASTRNFARDFQLRIDSIILGGNPDIITDTDLVFLKTAQLPGKTIAVQSAPFMGLTFNIPGSVQFDGTTSWQATFYCSQDYVLRDIVESIMKSTFSQRSSTGYMQPRDLQANKIVLSLVNDQFQVIRTYSLLGCFITNVGAMNYSVTGNGALVDLPVTIAYQYWEAGGAGSDGIAQGEPDFTSSILGGGGTGEVNLGLGVASAVLKGATSISKNPAVRAGGSLLAALGNRAAGLG